MTVKRESIKPTICIALRDAALTLSSFHFGHYSLEVFAIAKRATVKTRFSWNQKGKSSVVP